MRAAGIALMIVGGACGDREPAPEPTLDEPPVFAPPPVDQGAPVVTAAEAARVIREHRADDWTRPTCRSRSDRLPWRDGRDGSLEGDVRPGRAVLLPHPGPGRVGAVARRLRGRVVSRVQGGGRAAADLEERSLEDTTAASQRLSSEWCGHGGATRSLDACWDLVVDWKDGGADRAAAYAALHRVCAADDLVACGLVVRAHTSLLRQQDADTLSDGERGAAAALTGALDVQQFQAALIRLARRCVENDWAACGFCGDRRRGYPTTELFYVDRDVREATLPAAMRRYCDAQWLAGARGFRQTLLGERAR